MIVGGTCQDCHKICIADRDKLKPNEHNDTLQHPVALSRYVQTQLMSSFLVFSVVHLHCLFRNNLISSDLKDMCLR
jgi:hypothetical protein